MYALTKVTIQPTYTNDQYNNTKYRSNPDWLQGIESETI